MQKIHSAMCDKVCKQMFHKSAVIKVLIYQMQGFLLDQDPFSDCSIDLRNIFNCITESVNKFNADIAALIRRNNQNKLTSTFLKQTFDKVRPSSSNQESI